MGQEADVVVVGAGAVGLAAAIEAAEKGASVLVVEANKDVGGHAILSAGNIPLGGGTRAQKEAGIVDSPDLIFSDLTDWSVVEPNGAADYRFNDRDLVRVFADNNVDTFDWLIAHGVIFVPRRPDGVGGISVGNSVPRMMHCAVLAYPQIASGKPVAPEFGPTTSGGVGLIRPLEAAARKLGIAILLQHKMTGLIREAPARAGRRNRGGKQRREDQLAREEGRHYRYRRPRQQRELPPHLRSAPYRRVLRGRRASLIPSRTPAEKSPPWPLGRRFGERPIKPGNLAFSWPSRVGSDASTGTPT